MNEPARFSVERVIVTGYKNHLPNYSVFDEKRYFDSSSDLDVEPSIITVKGIPVGVCRQPLLPLTDEEKGDFRTAMEPILNW